MSDLVMPSSGHQALSGLLMAIPAIFTVSALTAAPGALGRILVCAKPEEGRLAKLAVGGPLRVGELRDELRANPGRVPHRRRGIERRLFGAQPLELGRERVERFLRKAGADLADIAELRSVVEADEKRAEMLASALLRRVPADHELRLLAHLDLAPEGRPHPGLVRRALVFRDDPFPSEPLRFAVRGPSVALEPSRQEERSGPASDEPFESRAALVQWTRHELSTVVLEEIEDRIARR